MTDESNHNLCDYDGVSRATFKCRRCKLNASEQFHDVDELCKACKNLKTVASIQYFSQRTFFQGLILIALFYLIPLFYPPALVLRVFIIPTAIITIGPGLFLGIFFEQIHFRGISQKHRIIPLLIWSSAAGRPNYYTNAIKYIKKYLEDISEEHKEKIFEIVIKGVILGEGDYRYNWIDEWSEILGYEKFDFVKMVLDKYEEEVLEYIKPTISFGLVPDLWKHLGDDISAKIRILEKYQDNIENTIPDTTGYKLQVFNDELYILKNDIIEMTEAEEPLDVEKFHTLLDYINDLPDPVVPKSKIAAMAALPKESAKMQEAKMIEERAKKFRNQGNIDQDDSMNDDSKKLEMNN
jgi:hypothetical protein